MNRLKGWGVLALVLVFSAAALAQYEGRFLGTVTDKSSGAVKDAKVTIVNVDTGASRSLLTNDAGDYVAGSKLRFPHPTSASFPHGSAAG